MSSQVSMEGSHTPDTQAATSAPSSPPEDLSHVELDLDFATQEERDMLEEERRTKVENDAEEEKRLAEKSARPLPLSQQEKAKRLQHLLETSEQFGNIITGNSKILGQLGSSAEGDKLGDHKNLKIAEQPSSMVGGTMRDYQLEGLTWMFEIVSKALSGILADEMGLGKTIQTISMIAMLREKPHNYYGPFLVIAPVSTLSNWQAEFEKWVPGLPVVLYHGTPDKRQEIANTFLMPHIHKSNKANAGGNSVKKSFPVTLTSPEIVLRDHATLSKIAWAVLIVDEGHRLKNAESKLFSILRKFQNADEQSRFLITGTPLQNNLKELWSLLHFLLPKIFKNWDDFEAWFDFSSLANQDGAEDFVQDESKKDLVKKIHRILQPLLLRRIKADVEQHLPRKREYLLYAPMTKEQTDLYNAFTDKNVDTRKYLETKVLERLTRAKESSSLPDSDSEDDIPLAKIRVGSLKRGAIDTLESPHQKSTKSSRNSTPGTSTRGRKLAIRKKYTEADVSEDDALSDEEFEQGLLDERSSESKPLAQIHTKSLEDVARQEVAGKKLNNTIMQLRLVCNSPHNFYQAPVDKTYVTSSGKMLLLDRLLPALFDRGHKVLIFSQFKRQLDILTDYAEELKNWKVCRIDGSTMQNDRKDIINAFNEEGSDYNLFLLTTRAGGQGINLVAADTVILFDSDWNPQQDLQAQDRIHRIGQTKPCIIFRLATQDTVEDELLRSAEAKRRLEKLIIKKGDYKSMGQNNNGDESDAFKSLLLKDGQVFKYKKGNDKILTDEDLEILLNRSDEAYDRAIERLGDATTSKFKVMETKIHGIVDLG